MQISGPLYCTVHYSGTLCHYYVNTVQYIIYCITQILYSTDVSRQYGGLIFKFTAFFLAQILAQFQLSHLSALCFFLRRVA